MSRTVRVLLAEDNLLVREGLASLLDDLDDVEVCGQAASADEVYALLVDRKPEVVVTDIRMPPHHRDEGVQLAQRLRLDSPEIGVVVLSQFAEPEYALAVFEEGSSGRGYVLKDRIDDIEHLVSAIRAVAAGNSFIDDEVVDVLVKARTRDLDSPLSSLSPRELDVLAELASGKTNASIAEALSITSHGVEKRISSIFVKLGLSEDDKVNRRVMAVLMFLGGREGL